MRAQQTSSANASTTPMASPHIREQAKTLKPSATMLSRTPTDLIIDPGSRLPPNERRLTRQYAQYFEFDDDLFPGSSPNSMQRVLKKARVAQDGQTEDRASSA
jgi:hypothetical protein